MKWLITLLASLKGYGFDVMLFIAGVAGAIAFLPKNPSQSWMQKFISVLSGGFAAMYLTPVVGNWLSLNSDTLYGLAFLVGYGGLKSVELAWQQLSIKLSNKNESNI